MSSILTNPSSLSALRALAATQKAFQATQTQISTGLRIATASDGISYWSMATQMKSDGSALGAVSDALNVSASMIDSYDSANTQVIDAVNAIKNSLVAAQQPGADLAKIQTDIAAQQSSIRSIVSAASFNGDNWLQGDSTAASATPGSLSNSGTRKLVASYTNSGGVGTFTVTTTTTTLVDSNATTTAGTNKGVLTVNGTASGVGVLAMNVNSLPSGKTIANLLTDVNTALSGLTTAGAALGGAKSAVTTQQTYISGLQDNLTTGVGALVDADMTEASTRLQALQTQQSLAIQALSLANQNAAAILALFRN